MNNLKIFFSFLLMTVATISFAQTKTESFNVSGECGMCKKTIEKAAKSAGASFAEWNTESKLLTVKFTENTTSATKIQNAIAGAGYDTPGVKATEEAYKNLPECCQYERAAAQAKACCESEKCTQSACMKDGKCAKDATCCKEAGCDKKDCCKKA